MADPTELDIEFRDMAFEIIEECGKEVTFTTITSTFDAATGTATDTTEEFVRKVSPPTMFSDFFVKQKLVGDETNKIIVAAKGLLFTPSKNMKVTFDGTTYRILKINPWYSGEQIAAYQLELDK